MKRRQVWDNIAPYAVTLLLSGCVPTVDGAHGPIALVDSTFADWTDTTALERTLGAWYPDTREIALDYRLRPSMRVLVLGHERCHAALSDARVELAADVEEVVCDAIAAGFRE